MVSLVLGKRICKNPKFYIPSLGFVIYLLYFGVLFLEFFVSFLDSPKTGELLSQIYFKKFALFFKINKGRKEGAGGGGPL